MIYADHAATTALSKAALSAMMPYLTECYGNPGSTHTAGTRAARAVLLTRESMAHDLCCYPKEICFTSCASEANNQALYSLAKFGLANQKRHLVSTAFEHPSVLRALAHLAAHGFAVTLVKPHSDGVVYAEDVAKAIRPETAAVSLMMANNEIGMLQPIQEIAALCHGCGVLLHTDAVQTVGHIPVDFSLFDADALTLSAHKFGGPKGVGAMILRHNLPPFPLLRGGGQERGSRAGTENVAGIVGMGAALRASCETMEQDIRTVAALREQLIDGMLQIPGVLLTGSRENSRRVPGTVHFCIEGVESETVLALLDAQRICASAGSACSAGALTESHVLKSIGVPSALAAGALRLSLGTDNTAPEVTQIVMTVREIVNQLRKG